MSYKRFDYYQNYQVPPVLNTKGGTIDGNCFVNGDITCQTLNYTTLNPPISISGGTGGDVSANIVYVDTIPHDISSVDYYLLQGVEKTARLLKQDPNSLFPVAPVIPSNLPEFFANDETTFRNLVGVGGTAGSKVVLTTDLTLTTKVDVLRNLEIVGDVPSRKITCSDTITLDYFPVFAGGSSNNILRNITIENTNTSSVATAVNIQRISNTSLQLQGCNIITNEFGISSDKDIVCYDCSFSFTGTADSHRYINIGQNIFQSFIVNCDFAGNGTNNTQCIFMTGVSSEYLSGELCVYNCRGGTLANPVQRLGICESDLTGTDFKLWLKDNDFTTTSGYFIFYNANALAGVDTIGLLNNIETSVSVDTGKGLIGCDNFAVAGDLGLPTLYAYQNQPASLRADYTSYSAVEGLVAYNNTIFTPTQTLELSYDSFFDIEGGGYALNDLDMNEKRIFFDNDKIRIGTSTGNTNQGNGAVAVGSFAGSTNQSAETVAIGFVAGLATQGFQSVAVGRAAGYSTQGANSVAIGRSAAFQFQGEDATAVGRNSGASSQGISATAVGAYAGNTNQGLQAVAVGASAGNDTQGQGAVGVGSGAGQINQGSSSVAIGASAGVNTQGTQAIAIGNQAGLVTQGTQAIAIGTFAGASNQGGDAIAIGEGAGQTSQRNWGVAIGLLAGNSSQQIEGIAIGREAGETSQSSSAVAIGGFAGTTSQGSLAVAIGRDAGNNTQGEQAIAIGDRAANTTQGTGSIAIGATAGFTSQGNASIAIGQQAGSSSQGADAIAIGRSAGITNQGIDAIAIGANAGTTNQANNSIIINATGSVLDNTTANSLVVKPVRNATTSDALYYNATSGEITYGTAGGGGGGWVGTATSDLNMDEYKILFTNGKIRMGSAFGVSYLNQGNNSIAIGSSSGGSSQGSTAIAIGSNAGTDQGTDSIAIGRNSGSDSGQGCIAIGVGCGANQLDNAIAIGRGITSLALGQGENSIAIGYNAGVNRVDNNTIILNATGNALDTNATNTFYVKPIRNATGTNALFYDATTGEITYDTAGGGGGWVGTATSDLNMDVYKIDFSRNAVRIADGAGQFTQSDNAIAIGFLAGNTNQGADAVAIGNGAGDQNQSGNSISIGRGAGNLGQGASSIAIGEVAGRTNQLPFAISMGYSAGNSGQGNSSVAIGDRAGQNTQGGDAIAIGRQAGQNTQSQWSVAVGGATGETNQGVSAVAIGFIAGNNTQGDSAVAIGTNAGFSSQGVSAVAIGDRAGQNTQGSSSVAIGREAGTTNQADNSIVINATGSALENTTANSFVVKPIRGVAHNIGVGQLIYDPTTGEITYSTN